MAKRRTDSEIRRALYRRVPQMTYPEVAAIRDRLTRYLIADKFKRGWSVASLAGEQTVWDQPKIESEIRLFMRLTGRDEA